MIKGIGVDIISLEDLKQKIEKLGDAFLKRTFFNSELNYAKKDNTIEHLGTTFAGKEAVFKALKKDYFEPKEIEIKRKNRMPIVCFHGKLKKLNYEVMLNLSFNKTNAIAMAIILENKK